LKNIKCNGITKIGNWRSIHKDYFEFKCSCI